MKTAEKVDRFIDALQKGSKNELMDVVSKLNKSDLKEMAVLLKSVRDILSVIKEEEVRFNHITETKPKRRPEFEFEIVPYVFIEKPDQEPDLEDLSEEEHREIIEKYAERAKTPPSGFIKYEGKEQLKRLLMKDKEEKGWKYKDE